jgi:hypothetical protein
MSKATQFAWGIAIIMAGVAVGGYFLLGLLHERALHRQAAGYQQQLQQVRLELEQAKAEAAAQLRRTKDEAAAAQQSLQTELDYERQPELPLKTILRPPERTGVRILYVENESREEFKCAVRLSRPDTDAVLETDFSIAPRAFKDLAAIDKWVFAPGDRIEFRKPGFKPRRLEVQ